MILETIESVLASSLSKCKQLRYCLVNEQKLPYKINGELAKTNCKEDFVTLDNIINDLKSFDYKGLGISIQASEICAIDIDHCFSKPFDKETGDNRFKEIMNLFDNQAYIEFSFSGSGLRILFLHPIISNYSEKYYIKNSKFNIEYYQPSNSYRYVTVTGKAICDMDIKELKDEVLFKFLNTYMLKPTVVKKEVKKINEGKTLDELMKIVRIHYIRDINFQELWFSKAPGSGADESERDFHLLTYIYENITQDEILLKEIFEQSPFFKSKDRKHVSKWKYQEGRYFKHLFNQIQRSYE